MESATPQKARRRKSVTDKEVQALARVPGRHSVGQGLILVVTTSGTCSWIARITDPSGRRRDIGLGRYGPREVTLKKALDDAAALRDEVRGGIDPIAARRAAKLGTITFKQAAEKYHEERVAAKFFKGQSLADQWIRTLRDHSYSKLGSMPVDQITVPMVVDVMKPILRAKFRGKPMHETARRVLRRIAAVVAWAVGHGYRDHELPMKGIRAALGDMVGAPEKRTRVPHDEAGAFLADLRKREGMAALALELVILTGVRSGEGRGAQWSEFDLVARNWTIPGDRMKARNNKPAPDHIVPLSAPAMALLHKMAEGQRCELVFPSSSIVRKGKGKAQVQPLSDVALSKVQKLIAPDTTVHGWRSTFRDWCAEMAPLVPGEIAEAALAHKDGNKVQAAYRRTNYLEIRRPLMEAWAAYLGGDPDWESKLPTLRAAKIEMIGQAA